VIYQLLQSVQQESSFPLGLFYLLPTFSLLFFFHLPSFLQLPSQILLKLLFFNLFHIILCLIFTPWQCWKIQLSFLTLLSSFQPLPNYFLQHNCPVISPLLFDLLVSYVFLNNCFQTLSKNEAISSSSTFFLWFYYWKYVSATAMWKCGCFNILVRNWETSGQWRQFTKPEMFLVHTYC